MVMWGKLFCTEWGVVFEFDPSESDKRAVSPEGGIPSKALVAIDGTRAPSCGCLGQALGSTRSPKEESMKPVGLLSQGGRRDRGHSVCRCGGCEIKSHVSPRCWVRSIGGWVVVHPERAA